MTEKTKNKKFLVGLARAFGGAILFAFPILMTMEMWHLGFHMDPFRLILFIVISIPLLAWLNYFAGFETDDSLLANLLDAFSAIAVGFAASVIVLSLFEVIEPGMSANEIVGKITVQSIPASIGAMLSRNQLGEHDAREERRKSSGFGAGIFLMAIGALYLSLGLAATEEMILISYKMSPLHVLGLMVFSLVILHGFIYAVIEKNKTPVSPGTLSFWSMFFRFTITAYVFSLFIAFFILWIFGRTDDTSWIAIIESTIVLGFPASLGAGAARLVL